MEFKKTKVVEAVKWLIEQYSIHADGDSENAHALATELKPGFASTDVVRLAHGHFLKDNDLGLKYPNLFDVPFGSYATTWQWAGQNPPGIGDKAIMNLVVVGEHETRKNIFVIGGGSGRVYTINNYNQKSPGGSSNPVNWRILVGEADLWSGSGTTHNQVLELSDNLTNYSSFKVWYNFNGQQVAEVYSSEISINAAYTLTDEGGSFGVGKIRLTPDGANKLKIQLLKSITFNENGNRIVLTSNDSGITIQRIKGLK